MWKKTGDGAKVRNLNIQRKCGRGEVVVQRGSGCRLGLGGVERSAVGSWLMKWRRIGVLGRCGYGLWGDEESRLAMAPAVTIHNSQGCREGTACGLSGVGCGRFQVAGRETRKRKRKDICRPNQGGRGYSAILMLDPNLRLWRSEWKLFKLDESML